jgi:hypothetical protein
MLPIKPENEDRDYLRQTLKMKIEDASLEWSEEDSRPETMATLRIPRQDAIEIEAAEDRCERLSFNPWHALASHKPMGGINRLRKAVYEASFDKRTGLAPRRQEG